MASYEIDINMSPDTISALMNGDYALYGFKAVQCQVSGGAPLVWFMTNSLLTTTQVLWDDQYQAYVSTSEIIANGKIFASATCDIDLGQTAVVGQNGTLSPSAGGPAGAVSILNQGSQSWTTGVCQTIGGAANLVCALPLYGNMLEVVAPIERVMLMFAPQMVNTGTVIYQAFAPGVLIDLTGAQQRQVTFDINQGWSWDGGPWAQPITPNSPMVPYLVVSP